MSAGLRRGLADLGCRILHASLPPTLRSWGWAIRCEAASIPDDTKALLFTIESLCGLMPRAIASRLLHPFASLTGERASVSKGSTMTSIFDGYVGRPRALGMICTIGAVVLGLTYLAMAGAPMRYLGINAGALVLGLTALVAFGRSTTTGPRWINGVSIATAGTLLATALLGAEVDGASRWVNLGGLAVQPSLVLLPVMLVAFARNRGALTSACIVVAAVAMALQPDRAMAGMLTLSLAVTAVMYRDRHSVAALAAGMICFGTTLVRADALPAVRYVDQILYSSFDVHTFAGFAVVGGVALLLAPAIAGWTRDPENRATYAAFGAVWLAAIMAASLGNYPTPIVGYGGSAIIGYALSILALPKLASAGARAVSETDSVVNGSSSDRHFVVAPA